MPRFSVAAIVFACTAVMAGPGSDPSAPGIEDRIEAQRAVERVQYRHRIGTKRSFEAAAPAEMIERKTRSSLSQSLALERFWATPVTVEALQREMERIRRSTLFPDRLAEIEAALGHDTDLILETFARPSLVDRLTRDFFAFDERIHGPARHQAEMLHRNLASGALDPRSPHPQRVVVELRRVEERGDQFSQSIGTPSRLGASPIATGPVPPSVNERVLLAAADYDARRALYPAAPGAIGDLEEQRDRYLVRAVLDEDTYAARVATWSVPKRSFDDWWNEAEQDFPAEAILPTRSGSPSRLTPVRRVPSRGTRQVDESPAELPRDPLCGRDDTWDTTPFDAHPHNMSGHTAVWTGEDMIVWGGREIGGYRYDPLIDHWTPMSVVGAPGSGPLVWTGNEVVVWDGETGGRYDPALDAWVPISNAGAPLARTGHSVVWTGAEVIVWGGYHKDSFSGFQTDLRSGGRYDPATDAWRPMTTVQAPSARQSHTALWTGVVMVVLGGYPGTAQGGRYDPRADTWFPTTTVSAQDALSAVWTGSEVILLSRESSWYSSFTVARRYDPVRDTYSPLAVPEDIGGSMVWSGEEVIVWNPGGGSSNRYNPATNTWKRIPSLNAPRPRSGSSMIWAGDRFIVWGGGTGGRYDPIADAWTPTATPAGPAPDAGPEAVWTGSEMIVWSPYAVGAARFDPLTSRWKSISPVGAPGSFNLAWTGEELLVFGGFSKRSESGHSKLAVEGARYDPIADDWRPMASPPYKAWRFPVVWTGSELLAWGGRTSSPESDNDHVTDAGVRYDPVRDIWTRIADAGAPTARESYSAVWTGQEMIVWGGYLPRCYDYDDVICDHLGGGRYDPGTDTWRSMSIDGPDDAYPVAWTGREMILWDGRDSRAYDPATDRWRYLPSDNSPPGVQGASVTMAGENLIVWGGSDGSPTQEGARYNTLSNTWTPMSTTGAPSPRSSHSAVWTGRGLIVWGGSVNAPSPTNDSTGGIYFMAPDEDHDGFASCAGDCDDDNPLSHPAAVDLPGNSSDEDCDGAVACDPGDYPRQRDAFVQCVAQECRRLGEAGRVDPDECRAALHRSGGPGCGDGAVSSQELCDGADLRGATCVSLGLDGGVLACNDSCDGFDLVGCETVCGDGLRAGAEACDGADVGGATCATLGFDGGSIACDADCGAFDLTACTSVCGDGVARGAEVCDEEDFAGRTCATLGFDDGTLTCSPACDAIDVSACTTVCGDGSRAGYEACDGADLAGRSCQSLGYGGGTLSCNASCTLLDESGCATCEDGFASGVEVCDGPDLRGETCQSQGLERGRLRCNYECNGFDLDGCVGCGNGVREGDELCDTYDTGENNCTTFGFENAWGLRCNGSCDGYDVSRCSSCGDGLAEGPERCDGADVYGQTCQGEGYDGGTLGCLTDCSAIDKAGCTTLCGDGVQRGAEQCDKTDLDHRSCGSLGYDNGTLACGQDCAFDTTGCGRCGNGIIEPGEGCEEFDLGGATCESLGFDSGTLGCWSNCQLRTRECVGGCGNEEVDDGEICDGPPRASCQDLGFEEGWGLECKATCDGFDTTGCWTCGDGVRQREEETCDGADVRGLTCEALGFDGGTLTCASDCEDLDTSGCTTVCGDGVRRGREKCDGDDVPSSCNYYGFKSGTLACNATCDGFDTSGCDQCGDGVKGPTEVCDLLDLGDLTCESFGFSGGTLRCGGYCRQLDFSGCTGCGNKVREGQEVCDGADVGGATCQNVGGYTGGTLSCNSQCDGFDVSGCTRCGDGFRNPVGENYEYCDGEDLGGRTCEMYGFPGGTLTCGADCRTFDTVACETVCGDGLVAGSEICDSRDFGALSCASFGSPGGGPLFCNDTCDAIDPSHCLPCGDGIIQGDEQCDSDNLRGGTCNWFGYSQGTLRCSAVCRFDTAGCYNPGNPGNPPPVICGDHRRAGSEVCDGADVGGQSCIGLGFDGGYLLCNETCEALDLSTCSTCGDNVRTHSERCDGTDLGGETCQTLGFQSGTLACTADCTGLDKTACQP